MTLRDDQDVADPLGPRPTEDADPLLRALAELPPRPVTSAPGQRAHDHARAAFVRAFEALPWHARAFGAAGRAAVPVVLASVVGLYLFWAFAVAIAINR